MRKELKFLIPMSLKSKVLKSIGGFLRLDEHGRYPVSSIYFDSPRFESYEEKTEGLRYRSKFRMRSYDYNFKPQQNVKIEVKRRIHDFISKRSFSVSPGIAQKFLRGYDWSLFDEYSGSEIISRFRVKRNFFPKVKVSYFRQAFQGAMDLDFRLTFDSYVSSLLPSQSVPRSYFRSPSQLVIPECYSIMEIKTSGPTPDWLLKLVKHYQLNRVSVSKYTLAIDFLNNNSLLI